MYEEGITYRPEYVWYSSQVSQAVVLPKKTMKPVDCCTWFNKSTSQVQVAKVKMMNDVNSCRLDRAITCCLFSCNCISINGDYSNWWWVNELNDIVYSLLDAKWSWCIRFVHFKGGKEEEKDVLTWHLSHEPAWRERATNRKSCRKQVKDERATNYRESEHSYLCHVNDI